MAVSSFSLDDRCEGLCLSRRLPACRFYGLRRPAPINSIDLAASKDGRLKNPELDRSPMGQVRCRAKNLESGGTPLIVPKACLCQCRWRISCGCDFANDGAAAVNGKFMCTVAVALVALSAPASAQEVTFSDLEGHIVEADIHREQSGRRQGQTKSARFHQNWKFSFNADKSIELTIAATRHGPDGASATKPTSRTFTLDEQRNVPGLGGGEGVWTFADGTLIYIRTLLSGAYRASFAFARGSAGLTCTVTEAWGREDGRGEIKIQSPYDGREVTIVSTKQLPSSCKVTRKQ